MSVTNALRDGGWMSRNELRVIAGDPHLERAWSALLGGDSGAARAAFDVASRSPSEPVAALAQVALVQWLPDPDQVVAACTRLAERFSGSADPTVRTAGMHALMVAAQQPGGSINALVEATRRADRDPQLRVAAADAHLETARWWLRRRAREPGNTPEADALAARAIAEYDAVLSAVGDDHDLAWRTIFQVALNEKTHLLVDMLDWPNDMTSSEQAVATHLPPDAPAILRAAVAEAWLTRGRLLLDRNDTTEGAVRALEELRRLFGSDTSPLVQDVVRQARQLEQRARSTHRRHRLGWVVVGAHVETRVHVPVLGDYEWTTWGRRAWGVVLVSTIVSALLGLWPVSRRILDTLEAADDAREQALEVASTAVFVAAATVMASGWLVLNARNLVRGRPAQWRALAGGLVLALALAGVVFAGGRITGALG